MLKALQDKKEKKQKKHLTGVRFADESAPITGVSMNQ
jgi:hypothetical protein